MRTVLNKPDRSACVCERQNSGKSHTDIETKKDPETKIARK